MHFSLIKNLHRQSVACWTDPFVFARVCFVHVYVSQSCRARFYETAVPKRPWHLLSRVISQTIWGLWRRQWAGRWKEPLLRGETVAVWRLGMHTHIRSTHTHRPITPFSLKHLVKLNLGHSVGSQRKPA